MDQYEHSKQPPPYNTSGNMESGNSYRPEHNPASNWTNGPEQPPQHSLKELFHRHMHEVIAYCSVFWSFGMCVAFLGPTLLDLGCQTSSDMRTISWVFFAQLLCSLLGSMAAGSLAHRINANLMLTLAASILPVAMFIIPFCNALTALALVLALMGLNMGCIDCLANLQMIQTFGGNVSPFLQAMHFFYGLGAFVSPMIAEPFLLNEDCTLFIDNITSPTPAPGMLPGPAVNLTADLPADSLVEAQEMTRVRYAFWILCLLQVPIPLIMGSLTLRMRNRGMSSGHEVLAHSDSVSSHISAKKDYENIDKQKAPDWVHPSDAAPAQKPSGHNSKFGSAPYQLMVVASATALICFIYDGLQSAFGGYVYSYAVKSIVDLNKTEGAYLNACFWGMFALGRLLSIFGATRLAPIFMLLCNIIGCMLSMSLMLGLRHDHVALYFGTCCFGLFISSITPSALSLAEIYIDVTPRIMAFIVVVAATGEMIFPVIVGNIFVTVGPVSFLWFGNVACFMSLFVYAALWFIGKGSPKHASSGASSFMWAHLCCLHPQTTDDDEQDAVNDTGHASYCVGQVPTESAAGFELSQREQQHAQQQASQDQQQY